MSDNLLIPLLSGFVAAVTTVIGNLLFKIWDRKKEREIKKIEALSNVQILLSNLGIVKPFDNVNHEFYFSIFDNIYSIELFANSISLINQKRFYLSKVIIDKIEMLESLFQDILTTCYVNQGNDDLTIFNIGAENFDKISRIKKDLRHFIDEELKRLK